MKIDKNTVRAPEIGRLWFNSPPLSMRQLRGRVVLVDFWDYTCVNCIRTLPYI
jgi:thiol-disulfide isomerase/thioredoxin